MWTVRSMSRSGSPPVMPVPVASIASASATISSSVYTLPSLAYMTSLSFFSRETGQ